MLWWRSLRFSSTPSILNRLGIDFESVLQAVSQQQLLHGSVIGYPDSNQHHAR